MITHGAISGFLPVTSVTSLYFPVLRMVSASVTLLPCDRLNIPSKSLFLNPCDRCYRFKFVLSD
jgi:hypothetical protein